MTDMFEIKISFLFFPCIIYILDDLFDTKTRLPGGMVAEIMLNFQLMTDMSEIKFSSPICYMVFFTPKPAS